MTAFFETEDHRGLTGFYRESGLEIEDGWEKDMSPVYSVKLYDNGEFCGAATVSRRFGIAVLDYIAVVRDRRKCGYGRMLLENVRARMRSENIIELYLTAKEPGFFKSQGAKETDRYTVLSDECENCLQYKISCFPETMILRCL